MGKFMHLQNILKFLIICGFNINAYNMVSNNPILFLPGIGGSKLVKSIPAESILAESISTELKTTKNIWPPTIFDITFNRNEWINDMKINYNENDFEPQIFSSKYNISTLEFGDKQSLNYIPSILSNFIKNPFEKILNRYKNIHPIPYDFRLVYSDLYLDTFYKKLTSYIESFNEPIIAITFSCGGILFHNFLCSKDIHWKNKHIKSVININVPFGGTVESLIHSNTDTILSKIINKDVIKSLGCSILIQPNEKIFADYSNIFKLDLIKKIRNKKKHLILNLFRSNNVNTKIIYSSIKKTPIDIKLINDKPTIIYGDGDGSVGLQSLLVPKMWNQKNINFIKIENYSHVEIFFSKELFDIIDAEIYQ